jgi:hypothetical protein
LDVVLFVIYNIGIKYNIKMTELPEKFKFIKPPVLILFLLILIFFPTIFWGKTLFYRDISIYGYPTVTYVVNSLKSGEFPLWNTMLFSGVPQMATVQPPLFYPNIILFILFPFHIALSLALVIHYFLAGLGVYLIGKYWKLNNLAALFGGIVFALNGYMFELNSLESIIFVATWLPYLFLYIEKFLDKPSLKYLMLIVLFNSLQLATGRLDYFYFSQMFLWPWIIFKFFSKEKDVSNRVFTKNIIFIIFSVIISLLLLSVQILPFLEYIKTTFRGSALSFTGVTFWSLHPLQLFQLVFNNFFGDLVNNNGIYVLLTDKKNLNFLIYNLYIGTPSLYLIAYALFKKDKRSIFLGLLALFFTLVSLGKYTPFFSLLYNYLPGFNVSRYPVKLFLFTIFPLSLLAMSGLDKLSNSNDLKKVTVFVIAGCSLLTFSVLLVYIYTDNLINYFNLSLKEFGLSVTNLNFMTKSLIFSLLISFIFLFLIVYFQKKNLEKPAFMFFLSLLVGYEFINNNISNLWIADSKLLYEKPQIAIDLDKLMDKDLYYLVQDTEAINPILNENKPKIFRELEENLASMAYNISLVHGFKNAFGYSPSPPTNIFRLVTYINDEIPGIKVSDERKVAIMKMMGVRFYIWHVLNINTVPPNPKYFTRLKQYPETGLQLWELKDYQSRFTFKTNISEEKTETDILKIFLGINKPDLDITDKVFTTSGALSQNSSLKGTSGPNAYARASVKLISETANSLKIDLDAPEPGYLVLANNYDKGWNAYDNGSKVEIFKANYYQQAIFVEKGKHSLEMIYKPFSFVIGRIISLLTLFFLTVFFVAFRKKIRLN